MKKETIRILGEYFFNVGIALVVAGVLLLVTDAIAIFWAGVIILIVGTTFKSIKEKKK